MMTIVTDLHGDLIDLDPVRPFFYPLQKNGLLRLISPEQKPGQDSLIRTAGHEACMELRRNSSREWQAIFLVSSKMTDSGQPGKTLGEQLETIRNKFISVIKKGGAREPERIFVINLDTVEREPDTYEPVDRSLRRIWEIDAHGYISDIEDNTVLPCFFTKSEIDSLARLWSPEISVELRNVRTDSGISELLGNESEKALGEKIETCCINVKKELKECINRKKEYLKEISNPELQATISDSLEQLHKEFSDDLDNCMNTNIARFIEPEPVKTILKKCLWECFSASSPKYSEFIFIRFPIKDWRGRDLNLSEYRRSLVRLAYLLIFLAEQGRTVFRSPTSHMNASNLSLSNFWVVRNIEINKNKLRNILSEYCCSLHLARAYTNEQLRKRLYDKLVLVKNICICGTNGLSRPETGKTMPVVQNRKEWSQWCEDVRHGFNNFLDRANNAIDDCRKQLADPDILEKEDNADIVAKQDEFCQKRQSLWEELKNNPFEEVTHDWPWAAKETDGKIVDIFSCLPNKRQFIIPFVFAAAVFIIPYIAELRILKQKHLHVFAGYFHPISLIFPLLVLLVGAISAFHIYRRYYSELNDLLADALRLAQRVREKIEKSVELNLGYIIRSCELCVAVRNERKAEALLKKANNHRMHLVCHETRLGKHLEFAENFLKTKPSFSDMSEDSWDEKIDYYQPPRKLPVYMPASACKEKTAYLLEMETTADHKYKSKCLPALERISIISDPAYSRVNR
ncbi:MAG: hypothetical protein GY749_16305 [Desulfobacteraceae bacterium]|nr:hypothetical protein [Desulfobacteraceae bacterium]